MTTRKLIRHSVGVLGVMGAYLGVAAVFGGLIFGNIAVGELLTPWLLLASLPVSVVIFSVSFALTNWAIEQSVEWAYRDDI